MDKDTPDTLTNEVLAYVVGADCPVRTYEVAEHLGVPTIRANYALVDLAARGLIVRVRRGLYSGDRELRRQALLDQLARLAPA